MDLNNINTELNKYIKKFYLFRIFKGIIFFVLLFTLFYFFVIVSNYFFYFSTILKSLVYWFSIIMFIILIIDLIFIPLLKYYRIISPITYEEASLYISNFYKPIQDKLLNILELSKYNDNSPLILASINQKYKEISFFSFSNSINYKELFKYLKYIFIPIVLFIIITFFNSNILPQGFKRFSNYSVYYSQPLPFEFVIKNKNLTVRQGEDFNVLLDLKGNVIPDDVSVNFGTNSITMSKKPNSKHSMFYVFKSVNNDINFYFQSGDYKSEIYTLKVIPSPKIVDFSIDIIPPQYTQKRKSTVNNNGDLIVPYGSLLKFHFTTSSADSLFLVSNNLKKIAQKKSSIFELNLIANSSFIYNIVSLNKYITKNYFTFNLNVVNDLFPSISISPKQDSNILSKYYFYGKITDDYGFSALTFNYQILDKNSEPKKNKYIKQSIYIDKSNSLQEFYYQYDFNLMDLTSDKIVYYFFSISDNDEINNYKTTNSLLFNYSLPSIKELDSLIENYDNNIQGQLNKASQLSFDLQKDIDDFNSKMLNENLNDWEKKEFINELLLKQKNLNILIDSLKNDNLKKINNLQNFDLKNEDLLNKQKQIQDLLDELITPEMKALLDQFKKLKENFNQKKFNDVLNKSNTNFKKLSDDLERSQELLKRMKLEQKVNSQINEFDKMSKDYQNISKSLSNNRNITDELKDSVSSTKFKLENLLSEYDSLLVFNDKLDKPYKLDSLNELKKNIQKNIDKLDNSISNNRKNQSIKNTEQISSNIDAISEKIKSSIEKNNSKSNGEDIQMIKFLLSNLLSFSFEQENILDQSSENISIFSKKFSSLKIKQLHLSNDFDIIKDSLYALAKRNPSISKIITDEVFVITQNLIKVNDNFIVSNRNQILLLQRKILYSVNKIALLLEENLKNMSKQNASGNGNSNSNSPGSNGFSDIKNFQKQMKDNLEQMINQMKSGKMPTSQQLGIQLAQREAFQKMIQDLINNNQFTDEIKSMLKETSQLNEKIQQDILNNNLNSETLKRDKNITTKLLESEKANDKRKFSDKRKSNTSENINHEVPLQIINSFKNNSKYTEIIKSNNLFLSNFYKKYYNEYVIRLRNQ